MKKYWVLLFLALLTGCLKRHGLVDDVHPNVTPIEIYSDTPQVYAPGSLFTDQNFASGLISDAKAFRINDIVLVSITESMTATNAANTDLERKNANSFKIPNLLGLEKTHTQFFGLGSSDGTVLGTSTESSHEGKGTTNRSDTFTGSVATRVVQVLPNGYLLIQGNKEVQVNGEKVSCYLNGLVNPLMISRDHIISSTQVADLKIRYGGSGIIAAQQDPGLFQRVLNFIWPF